MHIEMRIDELAANNEALDHLRAIARDHQCREDAQHYERELAENHRAIVEMFGHRSVVVALMADGGETV